MKNFLLVLALALAVTGCKITTARIPMKHGGELTLRDARLLMKTYLHFSSDSNGVSRITVDSYADGEAVQTATHAPANPASGTNTTVR